LEKITDFDFFFFRQRLVIMSFRKTNFFSFSIAEKETKKLVCISLHSKISILNPKLKELAIAQTAFNFTVSALLFLVC